MEVSDATQSDGGILFPVLVYMSVAFPPRRSQGAYQILYPSSFPFTARARNASTIRTMRVRTLGVRASGDTLHVIVWRRCRLSPSKIILAIISVGVKRGEMLGGKVMMKFWESEDCSVLSLLVIMSQYLALKYSQQQIWIALLFLSLFLT